VAAVTQREQLMALLDSFGITPAPPGMHRGENPLSVKLVAGEGGVEGYCEDGSFKSVAVWE